MAKFYKEENNGVYAVVTEKVYKEILERKKLIANAIKIGLPEPLLPPVTPVFTFTNEEHPYFFYMSGSLNTIYEIMEKGSHNVIEVEGDIYVPFSNGSDFENEHKRTIELSYRTNLDMAIKAFGLLEI